MMRAWLALGLAALLASCSGGHGRAPCPNGQRCMEVGSASEPFTLDPNKAQMVQESYVLYDTLIGLTTFDAAGKTVPGMAKSWTTSPDGLTWTFELRDDALWSDGVPVTANDFVTSMRRLQDPRTASPYSYLLYLIKGAEAINSGKAKPETLGVRALGPHRLELQLIHPAPYLPLLMVHSSGMPVPTHAIAKWGDAWVQPGHYVSNGPYTLASWTLGDRVVLRKNPRFFDAKNVCYDRVTYYPVTDLVSGERRVESGELDFLTTFASNRAHYLRERMPQAVRTNPLLAIYYLSFNRHLPGLGDKRVRTALSMSIDREFISDKLLGADQSALYSFVPPGMTGFTQPPLPEWASWPFEKRLAEARRLMKAAGYTPEHPLRFELTYSTSGEKVLPPVLQSDWRSIGAEATITPVEAQIHFSEMNARNFEVGTDSWYADFDDPTTFLQLLASNAGGQNHSDYNNPAYDRLLAAADQERDGAKRMQLLAQADALAMEDWPVAPLYVGSARNLLNPAVTGYIANPVDWHLKRFMCRKG